MSPARSSSRSPSAGRPWLAAYPAGVPTELDVPDVPLTRLLDDAADAYPNRPALAFLGTTTSYRELRAAVDRFAGALRGLGVGKGDRVALVLPNCPQNVISVFAVLRLGAVVVQNNPLYTEAELAAQLRDAGAKVVICLDKTYDTVAAVRAEAGVERVVVTSVVDYLPAMARQLLKLPLRRARRQRARLSAPVPKGADVAQYLTLMRESPGPVAQVAVEPATDLAVLQYTGGTTGRSRGAMLTHRNLVANAWQNRLWVPDAQPGREVTLAVLPLFHAYGLTLCLTTTMLLAGTLVLLPRFDLDHVLTAIDDYRPTLFPGVPPIYKALVDSPKIRMHDLQSIRACLSGAMKLPVETQEQFERVTGGRLVEGYGMTETSPTTHANPLTGPRKPGSIGVPLPGTVAKVVDPEKTTRELPVGEPGELVISGPQVFAGYWQAPDEPDVFTADGFLRTGDLAVMDEEGFFTVVDRRKELIIAGGFNIYPSEVEEVLRRHPKVAEVCVVGVPDRYRGETVKAFVVPVPGERPTADELQGFAAETLTAYKVPKLVELREQLPHSAVGKVLRRVLLEEERAKAGQAALAAAPAREAPVPKKAAVKKAAAPRKAPAAPEGDRPVEPSQPGGDDTLATAASPAQAPAASRRTTSRKALPAKQPAKKAAKKQAPTKKTPPPAE